MHPTDHPHPRPASTPTSHDTSDGTTANEVVGDLTARRRAQLTELLQQQAALTRDVAELTAHELPGADERLYELFSVEQAIEHGWPHQWEDLAYGAWLFADMAYMHHPWEVHPMCRVCQQPSSPTGTPPEPPTPPSAAAAAGPAATVTVADAA